MDGNSTQSSNYASDGDSQSLLAINDPNQLDSSGDGHIHCLVRSSKSKKLKSLYEFLTKKSNVNIDLANGVGNTALHLAVEVRDIELVRMLLAFGAYINPLNKWKKTPLDISSGYISLDRTESLVEIVKVPSVKGSDALSANMGEMGTLLRQCGAKLGCQLVRIENRETEYFVDLSGGHLEKKNSRLRMSEKIAGEGDDWCMMISKLHFELEQKIKDMFEDVSTSLVSDSLDGAAALGVQIREMKLLQMAGSRMLFLDGGGMKGLVEIDILCDIERKTGRRIVELFDWIVGTSTGAIIALALVYAKMSLQEVRRRFHVMKEPVFGQKFMSTRSGTDNLTRELKDMFGTMTMDEVKIPRVLISAVYKKTTNLKLHFFSNQPDISKLNKDETLLEVSEAADLQTPLNEPKEDGKSNLVWEVARYTSAAPTFFDELHNYVDGGILANNPSASGLTTIQQMCRSLDQKLPISLVVSIGTGKMYEDLLGRTDAHQFLFFGKHWLNFKDTVIKRGSNLVTLLGNAVGESESTSDNVKSRCIEQGIDYYRFSPHLDLDEIIGAGETDTSKLVDLVISAKKCSKVRDGLERLAKRFPDFSKANQKMSKRLKYCPRK